jgi:hypothetical protein
MIQEGSKIQGVVLFFLRAQHIDLNSTISHGPIRKKELPSDAVRIRHKELLASDSSR